MTIAITLCCVLALLHSALAQQQLTKKLNSTDVSTAKAPEGQKVYRGLAEGEDVSRGLSARKPGAGNSPPSHVAGKEDTQGDRCHGCHAGSLVCMAQSATELTPQPKPYSANPKPYIPTPNRKPERP